MINAVQVQRNGREIALLSRKEGGLHWGLEGQCDWGRKEGKEKPEAWEM